MAILIPYRQHDTAAVTMGTTGSTEAAARAQSELAAMEGIADLLARLPDAATRNRVLQWVDTIFRQNEPAPVPMPPATPLQPVRLAAVQEPKASASQECDLSVEDLEDCFEKPDSAPPDDGLPEADTATPVVSMIHGFVEDFQKLARDWQKD